MTIAATSTGLTSDRLRHVMGHFATGVTIVTAHGETGPVGMAVNSFTSVSLEPPLVLLCPARTSFTWPIIRASGRFCINVMGSGHADFTRRFCQKPEDRFADLGWVDRQAGPALDSAVAWIECEVSTEHEAGDHTIVVARVDEVDVAEAVDPLVFFRGAYGTFHTPAATG